MTKRVSAVSMAAVAVIVGLTAGCVTQRLAFTAAAATPVEVTLGNPVLVTATLNDPHGSVAKVIATVREVPEMAFELFDDGKEGDAVAGDGVWSCKLIVPPEAVPGTYHFDVTGYSASGAPITIRLSTGEVVPLTTTGSVTVIY
ncbi:MAG: hypothetical protein J7M12_02720 [Candidatus Hydrogenedentes bacterium]|nr:hypothetical protein [Candidatus Hydrogenedentota bacterium]